MGLVEKLPAKFRRRCESIATEQRQLLNLKAFEPLPANLLATRLNAKISTPQQVTNLSSKHIETLNSNQFSAAIISDNPLWIIYNSTHAPARRESNLMHEFAHVLLEHQTVGFNPQTGQPLRIEENENQATYLGGCLQIPRRGLLWAVQQEMNITQIAKYFGASEEMVRFRSNVTGVKI
ncbi:MAG: ImmA/IrrE family metallo-endopeptidase [Rivularia sp. (in: cyanobacteria)]